MDEPEKIRLGDGLAELIGVEWQDIGPDPARARLAVTPAVCQPAGIVHGGTMAALAETVCSAATLNVVREQGMVAMGQANNTTFLRPVSAGHVSCEARPRHRGRTTWVWDCELTDDEGRICCLARMTIAVRPLPASQPR